MSLFSKGSGHFNPYITAVIVVIWLALMGYLMSDRIMESGAEVAENFRIAAVESDDWFMIRVGGAYAGFGRSRQLKRDGGWTIRDDMNISLNLQG